MKDQNQESLGHLRTNHTTSSALISKTVNTILTKIGHRLDHDMNIYVPSFQTKISTHNTSKNQEKRHKRINTTTFEFELKFVL